MYDAAYIGDIQSPAGKICCHQDIGTAIFKFYKRNFTFVLLHTTMIKHIDDTVFRKEFTGSLNSIPVVAEYDCGSVPDKADQCKQGVQFIVVGGMHNPDT